MTFPFLLTVVSRYDIADKDVLENSFPTSTHRSIGSLIYLNNIDIFPLIQIGYDLYVMKDGEPKESSIIYS